MTAVRPLSVTSDAGSVPHEKLERLERMALLSSLTNGIGHDLRNLAMPALLRLDVLSLSPGLSDAARADVHAIRTGIEQLQRLANGLRLLSDDGYHTSKRRPTTELMPWWRDVRPIVEDALEPGTTVIADFPSDVPTIAMPPGPLAQVLVALALNARRAMVTSDERILTLRAAYDARQLRVTVADTGAGMNDETRRRCFEPFFSTHDTLGAAGVGLSSGRAMLRQFGGDLVLRELRVLPDRADTGATFVMIVPLVPPAGSA